MITVLFTIHSADCRFIKVCPVVWKCSKQSTRACSSFVCGCGLWKSRVLRGSRCRCGSGTRLEPNPEPRSRALLSGHSLSSSVYCTVKYFPIELFVLRELNAYSIHRLVSSDSKHVLCVSRKPLDLIITVVLSCTLLYCTVDLSHPTSLPFVSVHQKERDGTGTRTREAPVLRPTDRSESCAADLSCPVFVCPI